MSNFIPNETKRFVPRNPPWTIKPLKTMLNRVNRLFNNYKRQNPDRMISAIRGICIGRSHRCGKIGTRYRQIITGHGTSIGFLGF